MQIFEIMVGRSRTINLGNYESEKRECQLRAQLGEDDDVTVSIDELSVLAEAEVGVGPGKKTGATAQVSKAEKPKSAGKKAEKAKKAATEKPKKAPAADDLPEDDATLPNDEDPAVMSKMNDDPGEDPEDGLPEDDAVTDEDISKAMSTFVEKHGRDELMKIKAHFKVKNILMLTEDQRPKFMSILRDYE